MKVFVTGATGFIGSAIVEDYQRLARSQAVFSRKASRTSALQFEFRAAIAT